MPVSMGDVPTYSGNSLITDNKKGQRYDLLASPISGLELIFGLKIRVWKEFALQYVLMRPLNRFQISASTASSIYPPVQHPCLEERQFPDVIDPESVAPRSRPHVSLRFVPLRKGYHCS